MEATNWLQGTAGLRRPRRDEVVQDTAVAVGPETASWIPLLGFGARLLVLVVAVGLMEFVLLVAVAIVAGGPMSHDLGGGPAVAAWDLRTGDCFLSDESSAADAIPVVSCAAPHRFEMFAVVDLNPLVPASAIEGAAIRECAAALPDGVDPGAVRSWNPSPAGVAEGDREVGCYVAFDAERVGSIRSPIPPGVIGDQIAEVIAAVEEIRGLRFPSIPEFDLITSGELLERTRNQASFAEADPICELFRPMEPCGRDAALATAQMVAAYYEFATRRIVIPVAGDRLSDRDRAILAHELTHALTDGHFRIGAGLHELRDAGATDAFEAYTALVEGDANAVLERYIEQYLAPEPAGDSGGDQGGRPTGRPRVPSLLLADAWFTYVLGQRYVDALVDAGGFAAVDDAYRDPPPSTEAIVAAIEATRDLPVAVDAALAEPPEGFELVDTGEWGAKGWYELLWDGPDAALDVVGWGGASFSLYRDSRDEWLLYIRHRGDDAASVLRLFEALAARLPGPMLVGWPTVTDHTLTAVGNDYLWMQARGSELALVVAGHVAPGSVAVEALTGVEGSGATPYFDRAYLRTVRSEVRIHAEPRWFYRVGDADLVLVGTEVCRRIGEDLSYAEVAAGVAADLETYGSAEGDGDAEFTTPVIEVAVASYCPRYGDLLPPGEA
jgi:hypothetical protein